VTAVCASVPVLPLFASSSFSILVKSGIKEGTGGFAGSV